MKIKEYWDKFRDWIYLQGPKKIFTYILLALAIAVCIMVTFRPSAKAGKPAEQASQTAEPPPARQAPPTDAKAELERETERRLESILSLISGAGRVKVMVTLSSAPEGDLLAVNSETRQNGTTERDSEGGEREAVTSESKQSYVILKGSNGDETPLIIKPQGYIIEGVAIVAEGGDNIAVKDALTRAAYTVLGIPAHRVQVVKMKK